VISEDEAKEIVVGITAALAGDESLLHRALELASTTLMDSVAQWRWERV
jgi:hypothetical protein